MMTTIIDDAPQLAIKMAMKMVTQNSHSLLRSSHCCLWVPPVITISCQESKIEIMRNRSKESMTFLCLCLKLRSKVQLQFNLSSLIARPCWIKKLQLARSIYEWETKLEHIAQLLELCWRTIQMIAKRLISRDEEIIWARRKAKEIHCCFSGRSTCYLKIETYTPCLFNKLLWSTKNGQTSQGSKNSKRAHFWHNWCRKGDIERTRTR